MCNMEKNEITWDGTNTMDVVYFCIRYCTDMQNKLCIYVSLFKGCKNVADGFLMDDGKIHNSYTKYSIEIPTDADGLYIEAVDTMRGHDFCICLGQTVETYLDKDGAPMIRIKEGPTDA